MCRLVIIISLFSLVADAEPGLDIALKGGPNAATLAHDNRANRYGFSGGFGGYFQQSILDQFRLGGQMELLYIPRGAKEVIDGEYMGRFREHYFDVTVAVRPELRLAAVGVYLLLGGGLSLLVSAKKESALGAKQDITSELHRIDVSLLGGAGVGWYLPRREMGPFHLDTVFLEARHDVGLLDTNLASSGSENRTSSLMLGLSFVVGGPSARDTAQPVK